MKNPKGMLKAPKKTLMTHSSEDKGVVMVYSPPFSTMKYCPTTVTTMMMRKKGFCAKRNRRE